jgi:predicted MPP superfamily phosphohydrolase
VLRRLAGAAAGVAAGAAAWGWFEAGWVRLATRELRLPRLPRELDGLRIAHLSDFHLGVPSRGAHATERAVEWAAARRPDLVCITGDLLSRPRAERRLMALLARLGHPYVVLGNHDYALTRDPFSKPVDLLRLAHGTLLADETVELELRGRRVELAGVDARSWMRRRRSGFETESDADLRVLLCHFPRALDYVRPGRFDLILAGHMHAGQIVLPYGFGKVYLAHLRARYTDGVYERGETVMHVSPGLGTTFVPFRFFARPEATELVLRCG